VHYDFDAETYLLAVYHYISLKVILWFNQGS